MPVYFEGKRKKVRYGRDLVEVRFGRRMKKKAFAVFSADDNSLNFYKRFNVPSAGEQFEGKTVTEVYTGIETDIYQRDKNVPWHMNAQLITNVDVVDIIKPISTAYWFSRCYNLVQLDMLNIDTSNVTSMQGMFGLCKSLIEIDLSGFDTSNVTSMRMMFAGCYNLASLDVNNFNTSKVTNMSRMFGQCSSLANLSISNFNTSSVSDMSRMFEACSSIVELNLSHFNIKSVMNTYGMFRECKSLVNIDISGWNTSSVTNMSEMFGGCSSLRFLNISSFDTQRVEDMAYMFGMCNNLQKIQLGDKFAWRGVHGELPTPSSSDIPGADGKWYALSDGKGYAPENIPSNKADTYYAYPPTETYKDLIRTGVPAMGTSSDVFVSPSKRTKYRATLDTTSSASGRGMSVYIYDANSGSMINNVQLSITGARTQYFELNQGNYKINAFFDCHNGYPSTFILQEITGFNFAQPIKQGGVKQYG